MPADGRWDLTRRLKGYVNGLIKDIKWHIFSLCRCM